MQFEKQSEADGLVVKFQDFEILKINGNALNKETIDPSMAAVLSAASKVQYTLANVQAQINQTFPQAGDWAQFERSTWSWAQPRPKDTYSRPGM